MQWVHSTQKRRFGPAGLLSALRAALLPILTLLRPWRGEREGICKAVHPESRNVLKLRFEAKWCILF